MPSVRDLVVVAARKGGHWPASQGWWQPERGALQPEVGLKWTAGVKGQVKGEGELEASLPEQLLE